MRVLLLLILCLVLLCGCQPPAAKENAKPRVVTTVGMLADAARNVAGDLADVEALMGPGVDPHLYKPTPSDVRKLDGANIVLYVGLELEGRMSDVLAKMNTTSRRAIAVGESIPENKRRPAGDMGKQWDPHVWFDPELWIYAVRATQQALAESDPKNVAIYRANADRYVTEIEKLDEEARVAFAQIPPDRRLLVTAHDAFHYLGLRYGLKVKGLQGVSTVAEAGARDVQALAQQLVDERIPAIFVETSVPPAALEAVRSAARAKGWEVRLGPALYSDAMGAEGTPEGTYLGMFRHNVRAISEALR